MVEDFCARMRGLTQTGLCQVEIQLARACEDGQVLDVGVDQASPRWVDGIEGVDGPGIGLIVVLHVHVRARAQLLQVVHTRNLSSLLFDPGKHREEDSRKNGNNGYNDEKLDQSKSGFEPATTGAAFRLEIRKRK